MKKIKKNFLRPAKRDSSYFLIQINHNDKDDIQYQDND
jgi:hypothetical protein